MEMAEQTILPVIDKLFSSCLVKVERIDMSSYFICEICDAVFSEEDNLVQHMPTHVKNEDTEEYPTSISRYKQKPSNVDSICRTSHKKNTQSSVNNNNIGRPVTSIRDRIMFESDTDDELTESSEDGSLSEDACSTDDYQLHGGNAALDDHTDHTLNRKDTASRPSEILSINCRDTSKAISDTESKAANTKHILNKSYGKLLQCNICKESFAHNSSLKIHELTHEEKAELNNCLNNSNAPFEKNKSNNKRIVSITSDTNGNKDNSNSSLKIHKVTNQTQVSVTSIANDCKDNSNTSLRIHTRKLKKQRKNSKTKSRKKIQENEEYVCDICRKSFLKERSLKAHLKTHISDKPWKCKFCDNKFKTKQYMLRHERVHSNEKSYSCEICNESFRNHSSLSHHRRRNHNNEGIDVSLQRPTCAICNKQFSGKTSMIKHILAFHMTTGYPCAVCKKEFGHPIALASHMNIHKSTFKCRCGKSFQFKSDLKRHEYTHKKSLYYECDQCHKRFGRKDHIAKHLKNVCMIQLKVYDCPNCHSIRKRRVSLATHLKTCKRKKYCCSKCNRGFDKLSTKKRHQSSCKKKTRVDKSWRWLRRRT